MNGVESALLLLQCYHVATCPENGAGRRRDGTPPLTGMCSYDLLLIGVRTVYVCMYVCMIT